MTAFPTITDLSSLPVFYAVELQVYQPAAVWTAEVVRGQGTHPDGARPGPRYSPAANFDTVRASDLGYRTAPGDAGGVVPYPPRLTSAFQISVTLNLDPTATGGAAVAWGSLTFANAGGYWDAYVASRNCDSRSVKVLAGRKAYDPVRGVMLDPPYSALSVVFSGLAQQWQLAQDALTVPLRDATYWLEQPLQGTLYGGAGGIDGTADLAGKPKPMTRGGTAANPVKNVTPILVDPVNLVYQWTDCSGYAITIYEGGDGSNITYSGDYADITAQAAPPGGFITCNAKGFFKLGTKPFRGITADVVGNFPSGAVASDVFTVAKLMLAEDALLSADLIDGASFDSLTASNGCLAGVFISEATTAEAAVSTLLAGAAAQMIPLRNGKLRPFLIRAPIGGNDFRFSLDNIVTITVVQLPATLDPPPFRWRVAYGHNYTVQAAKDLSPSATTAQQAFAVTQDRYSTWISSTVQGQYARPADPAPVGGSLLNQNDAAQVAARLGTLAATRRRCYLVEVPLAFGIALEIGADGSLAYPMDNLAGGQLATIIGLQFSTDSATISFTVLV